MVDVDIEREIYKTIDRIHKEGVASPEINDILDEVARIYKNRQEWYLHRWYQPNGKFVLDEFLQLQNQLAKKGVKRDEFADAVIEYIDDTCFVML